MSLHDVRLWNLLNECNYKQDKVYIHIITLRKPNDPNKLFQWRVKCHEKHKTFSTKVCTQSRALIELNIRLNLVKLINEGKKLTSSSSSSSSSCSGSDSFPLFFPSSFFNSFPDWLSPPPSPSLSSSSSSSWRVLYSRISQTKK